MSTDKAALLDSIESSRLNQLTSIEMLKSAAILAVNQVTNKKIELIESGPEPKSFDEKVFELYLSTLVTIAEIVIQAATAGFVNSILRSRSVFKYAPKSAEGMELLSSFEVDVWDDSRSKELLGDILHTSDAAAVRKLYSADALRMLGDTYDKGKEAIKKIGESKDLRRISHLDRGDTHGTALLKDVLLSTSLQSFAIQRTHSIIRDRLILDLLNPEQTTMLSKVFSQIAVDLDTLRLVEEVGTSALFFEKILWVKHYQGIVQDLQFQSATLSNPRLVTRDARRIDIRLSKYFIRRITYKNEKATYLEKAQQASGYEKLSEQEASAYNYLREDWQETLTKLKSAKFSGILGKFSP